MNCGTALDTFAVGFLVRPFGALFFGRIGDMAKIIVAVALLPCMPFFTAFGALSDKIGRKRLTMVSLLLPLIGLGLCATTGNIYAGLYYPMGIAALMLVFGMIFLKETHGTLIWDEVDEPAEIAGPA